MSPPGQLYDEATDGLKKVFLNRKGDVEGPFGDRWGEFISAYYPILDGKGENVVAVLGVDVTSDVWTDLKKHKTRVAFFVALVSLAMMSLAVFGLQKFFKKSEHLKDLQEKDERIFQIAEHSRSIFWETNTHGVFTYMSPTWKTLLGYEESDFLNKKNFYELDLFEHNPDVSSQLRLCFEKRESVKNLVKTVRAKNGDLLKFNTYTFPFYSPQGEYLGYRGIDTDVTLKVQAEQIKNDLQKEFYNSAKHTSVETLAAGISHEINNPWPSFMALFPY